MMKIGAQMYTVREFCKDLDGFAETLAKLADLGFKFVQVSGTCAYEGEWLNEQLKKNGLECVITHNPYNEIMENTQATEEEHKTEEPAEPVVEETNETMARIRLIATAESWIEIQDEDTIIVSRVLNAGESYDIPEII